MRTNLARALRFLADLIQPNYPSGIYSRADFLITKANKLEQSGEYKRHVVYSQLIKEFPNESKRDLSYLIESILQARL